MRIPETIKHILPNLEFWEDYVVCNNSDWKWDYIIWYNKEVAQPTEVELLEGWKSYEAGMASTEYQRLRVKEYPSLEEQLDLQYKDALNWTTKWIDLIKTIKEKYPKPE